MFDITPLSSNKVSDELTDLELAQALAERSVIPHQNWHRLKGNRSAQAKQQLTSALVFLLQDRPQEALQHLEQAAGWLNGSLASPPCPDAEKRKRSKS